MLSNIAKLVASSVCLILIPTSMILAGHFHRESKKDDYLREVETRQPLNKAGTPYINTERTNYSITSMISRRYNNVKINRSKDDGA